MTSWLQVFYVCLKYTHMVDTPFCDNGAHHSNELTNATSSDQISAFRGLVDKLINDYSVYTN